MYHLRLASLLIFHLDDLSIDVRGMLKSPTIIVLLSISPFRPGGATPYPRSGGCMGAEGPRGASPCSRSGGVATRKCPLSTVRSSGCALLE